MNQQQILSNALQSKRRLCVVVIEPRAELGFVTKRFLEHAGHEVHYAADGRKGIELVVTHSPDVVTTSIEVPELDGFEIASEIRERLPDKPRIVATTSYAKSEIGSRLRAAGFDCYLAKPFLRELLLTAVEAKEGDVLPEELVL